MQEVAVVTNGYTAQYGRMAGVQMDSVTKSGSNQFHGNANYFYNGTVLNANDWFNPSTNTPRPFAVNNQWSASFGGPIIKNKTFFFADTEGLRYTLPSTQNIFLPTAAFETAVLNNLTANGRGAEIPFYNQMFSLYNNAPGHANYSPVSAAADPTQGCADLTSFSGFGAGGAPCALFNHASGTNHNKEWLLAVRVDQNIGTKDKLFGRVHIDRGSQPTGTDLIDPQNFNTLSVQPEDDGQLNETHVFSPNVVNQLVASGMWYSAVFTEATPVGSRFNVLPYNSVTLNGILSNLGGIQVANTGFPQGRNATQYQILDDLSINHGNHTFKVGVNFRRNSISDFGNEINAYGTVGFSNLTDFANGLLTPANGNGYSQNFTEFPRNPLAVYSLGIYFQDEWTIKSNLRLTAAIRADRNSNAVCETNCFSRLVDPSHRSITIQTFPTTRQFRRTSIRRSALASSRLPAQGWPQLEPVRQEHCHTHWHRHVHRPLSGRDRDEHRRQRTDFESIGSQRHRAHREPSRARIASLRELQSMASRTCKPLR